MENSKYILDKLNFAIGISGLVLVLSGLIVKANYVMPFFNIEGNDFKTILVSIGCSLIASSIMTYFSSRYIVSKNKTKDLIEEWCLIDIYKTRSEMNINYEFQMKNLKYELDIIAFGLRSFRGVKGNVIEEKVKKGLKIRIITHNPESIFLKQRELDEN